MTSDPATPAVYGEDRVRRLRIAVGALAGTALVGLVIAAYVLASTQGDDADGRRAGIVLAIISTLLLAAGTSTWIALPRRSAGVRRAAAGCGFLAIVAALPTAGLALGFVWAVIGLAIVFLSLGPDEP